MTISNLNSLTRTMSLRHNCQFLSPSLESRSNYLTLDSIPNVESNLTLSYGYRWDLAESKVSNFLLELLLALDLK